ncbi:DUF814 domain-containing protein [bacterium]|nr:MAG: DUF814 domain-containing protein [bacterium]
MNNYYTIKILHKEIHKRLENSVFESAFSGNRNTLTLCFLKGEEELRFVLSFDKGIVAGFLTEHSKEPKSNVAFFFEELENVTLKSVTQLAGERAFIFQFDTSVSLYLSLFGSVPNAYLVRDEIIEATFKQEKKWKGKPIHDVFPMFVAKDKLPTSPKDAVLIEEPKLPRHFVDELIHYAGEDLSLSDWQNKAKEWVAELENNPVPRLLADHRFTLFSEKSLPIETKLSFDSVNEGIRRSWFIIVNEGRLKAEKDNWMARLQQRLRYLESLIEQASGKEKQEKQAEIWQNYGHLLMSQPNPNQKQKNIRVFDYFDKQTEITIPLKEDLTLIENANRFYKRSVSAKKSIEILERQAQSAQENLAEIKPVLLGLAACSRYQQFVDWKKQFSSQLETFTAHKQQVNDTEGFGSFTIDGYEIWMGKNAKSNDIILQKAHKEDLWFHARGVGGSHVLVRMRKQKENPPKWFMEKIASLAAWHSQAKGSSMVPVQVARRKYLRKPKGADAGLVLVDKEEVLLVKPDRLQ